jgi:hypothetical protein
MPQDPHPAKGFESLAGTGLRERAECTLAPESTRYLKIQHMRCVYQPRSMKPLSENCTHARMH